MNNLYDETKISVGHRLNDYVLTREIGYGGHGIVYQAYHEDQPSKLYAIKIINDTGSLDTQLVEPEILSKLQHPNIVRLQDYFLHEGKLILVMDYIEGTDLQSYLEKNGPFTPADIKTFLTQMGYALSHAHANNIIHRDLKPSNILVSGDNQQRHYVLVDFGISRIAEGIQTTRRVAGTYSYMAPEQLRGRPCAQSDLWSLGVIAYVLLTGVKPFDSDNQGKFFNNICYRIPQIPSAIIGQTDDELERIIFQLLEKQLANRPTSADELLDILEKWALTVPQIQFSLISSINPSKDAILSWEQQSLKAKQRNWILFWTFFIASTIPFGIIGEIVALAGGILFFIGQETRSILRTVASLVVILVGAVITLEFPSWVTIIYQLNEASASALVLGQFFLHPILILIALHFFVKTRSLDRDLLLHKAIRTGSLNPEHIIGLLRDFVHIHSGDINIHQKYVEVLLSVGKTEDAIVESKRILDSDPYNFGATLMLAHGYFEIGLYEECVKVCNSYLAISGYSFEFSDLIAQCAEMRV